MRVREYDVRGIMERAGVPCTEAIELDGKVHRFKVGGQGNRNGWYWFIERGGSVYGTFGNWKTGQRQRLGEFDGAMRTAIRARVESDNEDALKAAITARDLWASLSCTGESEYLDIKGVPSFGLRFGRDKVWVPMLVGGQIVGLQGIDRWGVKLFTKGCAKKGASYRIEGNDVVALAEGYATGASVHMATGMSVLVCFDAGNMIEVAKALPPGRQYVVCGDNDHNTVCQKHKALGVERPVSPLGKRPSWCLCNPGHSAALNAARILRGKCVIPHCNGTDFNDLHQEQGLEEVADQIFGVL